MKHLAIAGIALLLSAGASAAADIPQVAVDTCLKHADAYTGAAAGTAKSTGNVEADVSWFGGPGGNFRLAVDAGGTALSCVVSPDGKLIALAPAN
ncbi:hypothetical protein [Mesorhizobium sp. IMUNJ 23232]|uniref:hypothetical protein n=1 Tax=Mesorhizobium sp. IMUNJ 23232 TaxID=3376064 RepID=UPI0037AF375C